MADAYTPVDGLKNLVSFPTDPPDEPAARKQIQDMLDQILGFHNAHLADTAYYEVFSKSSNQSCPEGSTNLTFSTRTAAGGSDKNMTELNGSNGIRIKKPGVYRITANQVTFAADADGYRLLALRGLTVGIIPVNSAIFTTSLSGSRLINITADNTDITVSVAHNAGGALDVLATGLSVTVNKL